jgi:hypothetical protein
LLLTAVTAAANFASFIPQWLRPPQDPYHMDVLEGLGDHTEGRMRKK